MTHEEEKLVREFLSKRVRDMHAYLDAYQAEVERLNALIPKVRKETRKATYEALKRKYKFDDGGE
jgi:hypothetical protein